MTTTPALPSRDPVRSTLPPRRRRACFERCVAPTASTTTGTLRAHEKPPRCVTPSRPVIPPSSHSTTRGHDDGERGMPTRKTNVPPPLVARALSAEPQRRTIPTNRPRQQRARDKYRRTPPLSPHTLSGCRRRACFERCVTPTTPISITTSRLPPLSSATPDTTNGSNNDHRNAIRVRGAPWQRYSVRHHEPHPVLPNYYGRVASRTC